MQIVKHIPNTITCLNLLCGAVGVVLACKGRIDIAFPLMLAAAVCDFLDGFAARLLGAYSDTGKELDSLADDISFGLLPAVMLCVIMRTYNFADSIWCYVPLIISVFSALRLAKFNIDERQHESFLGLPTPACAMICGSLAYFTAMCPDSFLSVWCAGKVFIPVLSVVLSYLLVCEVPFFSIKIGKGQKTENRKRIYFGINLAIVIAIVAILGLNWSMAVLFGFTVYILMNLAFAITAPKNEA